MSQHDFDIANQSGSAFRADLNNALLALASASSGASAPATTYAYQIWADTTNSVLKIRNAANTAWIDTGISLTADRTIAGMLKVAGNVATYADLHLYDSSYAFTVLNDASNQKLIVAPCTGAVGSPVPTSSKGLEIAYASGLLTALAGLLVSGGDLTLGSGRKIIFADASSMAKAAKRLIVHQVAKTDTFTTTSTSYTDVTGLSVNVTPQSATSVFLLLMQLKAVHGTAAYGANARLVRDSTALHIGDAASNRVQASAVIPGDQGNALNNVWTVGAIAYDAPATASAIVYKVQARCPGWGGTVYVNRSVEDDDDANRSRTASSLVVLEIAD